jgi:methyltransferase (TIGR00027 family)
LALSRVLPNFSLRLTRFLLWPQTVHYGIAGRSILYPTVVAPGKETLGQMITARTSSLDEILESAGPRMRQVVFLGAGYDTRAFGPMRREELRFFEVDLPVTQALKIASLDRAGLSRDHVTFVTTDFESDNFFERLAAAGYDPQQPTLFLWEGVTLCLAESDVRRTLADIRAHAGAGSVIACDFYSDRMVQLGKKGPAKELLKATDEALGFSLPFAEDWEPVLEQFLVAEGWHCATSHFLGSDSPKGPFTVVAELRATSAGSSPGDS